MVNGYFTCVLRVVTVQTQWTLAWKGYIWKFIIRNV